MITHNDQLELLGIISKSLTQEITCYAFGGTAMMFYGYKGETKDVDLLFEDEPSRKEFIRVLSSMGFDESSPFKIYIDEKLRDPHRPLMYKREDIRFDLFVSKIFQTALSPGMKEDLFAVHEFTGKHTLTLKVLRAEQIIILKSVTERDKDFEDIITILRKTKNIDWQYLIDEVLWQCKHGDGWVLIDMIKTIKELKRYVFIEGKYLKRLTAALR